MVLNTTRPGVLVTFLASSLACALTASGCGSSEDVYDEGALTAQSGWAVHTACGQGATTTSGVDVSKWQSSIDWPSVKSDGVVFAFVRVSDGTQNIDPQFAANWQGTKAAGIIRGAYQYFRPSQSATGQAELFVDQIEQAGGFESGDLPGVIDVETVEGLSTSDAIQAVQTWIDYVETHTGRRPIIYAGSYFWDDNSFGNQFSDYALWTPHYTSAQCPLVSDAWDHWTFWQHTNSGSVNGIAGDADEDVFDGSLTELEAFIANSVIGGGQDAGPDSQPDAALDANEEPPETQVDAGDGATGDGATGDGATGDGATADGATADGATADGATGDSATGDSALGDSATGAPEFDGGADPVSSSATPFYPPNQGEGCAFRRGTTGDGSWLLLGLVGLAAARHRRRRR
jgi:GH25 family lysozyme M1 (1,4-beta-N-acetylmuramidase)